MTQSTATSVSYQPSHFGICVSDLDRSLRFYCDGLGFEKAERYDLEDWPGSGLDRGLEVQGPVALVSQFIRSAGMGIELLHFTSPVPNGTPSASRGQVGITHLSFYVDDVDKAAARLVEHGGTLLENTRSNPGVDLVFLSDPDGVRVELMQSGG
jgi:catechol 2,3-dioxygenase-like lactoylglutathione lyase family enzyme